MSEGQGRGGRILSWWQANIGNRDSGRARALAARLRRAGMIEALAEPEVHDLSRALSLREAARLVRLAQVLAHVREHAPARLPQRLGGPEPAMSTLRFQRLLRASREDLTAALVRALPMADRRCNVAALGESLLDWDDPDRGDRVRANWCFDYFGAPPPGAEQRDPEESPA